VRLLTKGKRKTKLDEDDGVCFVRLELNFRMDVCKLAPTKVDFINALGYIQPSKGEKQDLVIPQPTREWLQMVAEKIS
jgi:hypothetical protein